MFIILIKKIVFANACNQCKDNVKLISCEKAIIFKINTLNVTNII